MVQFNLIKNRLKYLLQKQFCYGNSIIWASTEGTKDLLLREAPFWIDKKNTQNILDVGSGGKTEIELLAPNAKKYYYLDSNFLPKPKRTRKILKQRVEKKWPIKSSSIDLITTNGSFDHFSEHGQEFAFKEMERVLVKNGLILFACEYFLFQDKTFFTRAKNDKCLKKMNCPAFANINLCKINKVVPKLKLIQKSKEFIPNGNSLSNLKTPNKPKIFQSKTEAGLKIHWGSFFCVYKKIKS